MLFESLPQLIDRLQSALRAPLPGHQAHMQLAPYSGRLTLQSDHSYRSAAVAILLYPQLDGQVSFSIIKRTYHPTDNHSGQIALPGGAQEIGDASLTDTALREVQEELGINGEIEIIAPMSTVHIPVSKFSVTPFLAYCRSRPSFEIQTSEVAVHYSLRLRDFWDQKDIRYTDIELQDGYRLINVPHFLINDLLIWGATAMILNEFIHIVERSRIN